MWIMKLIMYVLSEHSPGLFEEEAEVGLSSVGSARRVGAVQSILNLEIPSDRCFNLEHLFILRRNSKLGN